MSVEICVWCLLIRYEVDRLAKRDNILAWLGHMITDNTLSVPKRRVS
jgi:hypothetical protein